MKFFKNISKKIQKNVSMKIINKNKLNNSVLLDENKDETFNANNNILVELNKINLNYSDTYENNKDLSDTEEEIDLLNHDWKEDQNCTDCSDCEKPNFKWCTKCEACWLCYLDDDYKESCLSSSIENHRKLQEKCDSLRDLNISENNQDENNQDENNHDENNQDENNHDENNQDEHNQDEHNQDENNQDENEDEHNQDENNESSEDEVQDSFYLPSWMTLPKVGK